MVDGHYIENNLLVVTQHQIVWLRQNLQRECRITRRHRSHAVTII